MIEKLNNSLFLFCKLIDYIKAKEGVDQANFYTKHSKIQQSKLNNKEYENHKA